MLILKKNKIERYELGYLVSLNIVDELVQAAGKAKSSHTKPIFIDADPQEELDRRSVTTDINLTGVVKTWKYLSLNIIDELVQQLVRQNHRMPNLFSSTLILEKNEIEGQSIQI